MASNRDTSNGPDWRDVVRAGLELGAVWEVPFRISLLIAGTAKNPDLLLVARTEAEQGQNGAVVPWGSASVSMGSGVAGSLEAGLLRLLYELDGDIYRNDEGISGKGA